MVHRTYHIFLQCILWFFSCTSLFGMTMSLIDLEHLLFQTCAFSDKMECWDELNVNFYEFYLVM